MLTLSVIYVYSIMTWKTQVFPASATLAVFIAYNPGYQSADKYEKCIDTLQQISFVRES